MMNENWESRTELLLGSERIKALHRFHILIAGLGGVGAYAAEQLCRAGIGRFTLVDYDIVQASNRNRQLIALTSTQGKKKILLVAERMKDINPDCEVKLVDQFLKADSISQLLDNEYDYVVDAIDTLSPKVELLSQASSRGLKVVSSFGSGGKTDPARIRVADIEKSHGCKFGHKIRKALHRRNIRKGIKVVFSPEEVEPECILVTNGEGHKRSIVGTVSYMPAVFGCFCASTVIQDLLAL